MKLAIFILQITFISGYIVTDRRIIFKGVPVDYNNNETDIEQRSSPGCPKPEQGYPWVLYGNPPRCFPSGNKGPCGDEQILSITEGSAFGYCACDCLKGGVGLHSGQHQFCTSEVSRKEFVFIPERRKCFELYEQGPCKYNEWLVKAEGRSYKKQPGVFARCKKRKCPPGFNLASVGDDEDAYYKGHGKCVIKLDFQSAKTGLVPNPCKKFGMRYSKLIKRCVYKLSFGI